MSAIVKKIRVDIISLIMVIVSIYFLGIFGLVISSVLLVIYIKTAKEHNIKVISFTNETANAQSYFEIDL